MKNILTQQNKILLGLCVLCAVFLVAMLIWNQMIPVDDYELIIQNYQGQIEENQAELDRRMAAAQSALDDATAAQLELNAKAAQLQSDNAALAKTVASLQEDVTEIEQLPETILQTQETYGNKVRQLEEMIMAGETDVKICYMTFDDGPNNLTASLIEKLDALDIYATFFTIGSNSALKQTENLRAEMMAGHTVANHTYSHAYNGSLYRSFEEFKTQVLKQDENVFNATGFHMNLFRFPSGSVACPFLDEADVWLKENGYQWIDWNASAWDSGLQNIGVKTTTIYRHMVATYGEQDIVVMLCHDFNAATIGAMDMFVPKLQEEGYIFLPLFPQSHTLDEPLPVV